MLKMVTLPKTIEKIVSGLTFKDSMENKSSLLSKIQEREFISGIKLIDGSSAEEL